MNKTTSTRRLSLPASAFLLTTFLLLSPGNAEEWTRVAGKDGSISALFPVDLKDNPQSQTDRTIAGKVTSYFGEYHGDGIILAGSGSDIPALARTAGNSAIFNGSKKTFLEQAQGTETGSKEITVAGAPALEVIYRGNGYQGKGAPYTARALFIIHNKRMYIINAVISKQTAANRAAADKMFGSIRIAG